MLLLTCSRRPEGDGDTEEPRPPPFESKELGGRGEDGMSMGGRGTEPAPSLSTLLVLVCLPKLLEPLPLMVAY